MNLNIELQNVEWHHLLSSSDTEKCWQIFKSKLESCCDKHIPKVTIKNGFQPPWFDSEVFSKCREKERVRIELKCCRNQNALTRESVESASLVEFSPPSPEEVALEIKFKNLRRQVNQLIRAKMRSNFSEEQRVNTITKKFWSYVKATSNTHRIPESVHHNGVHRSNTTEQANLFNNYFFEQFSSPSIYDININYSANFDIQFKEHSIKQLLKNLDPNKAPGPDNIHGKVLKNCANSLALPLTLLFQTSYYTCKIPADWKNANIVPVFKKGNKNDVCNYRPISLTSLVMKVYERVIRAELLPRVVDKLDHRQHGFLPQKSCETQLIPFYDRLARSLNEGSRTDIIYFDFAKAFDSVNHDIILQKLKYNFKIDGLLLKFFVEYLSNRYQRVVVGNEKSSEIGVLSGVPQGSILGPILFVIFINDSCEKLSPNSEAFLYADDTKLYREIKSADDQFTLQRDINTLSNRATLNKMKFHKCKLLSVTLQRDTTISNSYYLDGKDIAPVCLEKDLGVHIGSKLTWTDHCNYLYSKANRNLGLLKRTCKFVNNRAQRRSLYLAMVRSQFEHCSTIWSPSSETSLDKLESIQKRGVKWIFDEQYCSYSNELYYLRCKELNILPIRHKLIKKDLKMFFEILNKRVPIDLPEYLSFHSGVSRLRHSHLDNLSIVSNIQPRVTRNYGASTSEVTSTSLSQFTNSYFYRTMNCWNSLPHETRSKTCSKQFESAVHTWLWQAARPLPEKQLALTPEIFL